MAENKTKQTEQNVMDFILQVEPERRRADALILLEIFTELTGFTPRMWGASIIGFGSYHYTYESGHQGDSPATGFSPRKANQVIYIMPGYTNFSEILDRLGKYKKGKSCLYINKLADVDLDVLRQLITAGLTDLNAKWPVRPS